MKQPVFLWTLVFSLSVAGCASAPRGQKNPDSAKEVRAEGATIRARKLNEEDLKKISAFAQRVQSESKIPGLSFAVVQGGKTLIAQGFGHTTIGGEVVDANTRFMIGSTTKAMTSTMIATR